MTKTERHIQVLSDDQLVEAYWEQRKVVYRASEIRSRWLGRNLADLDAIVAEAHNRSIQLR